MQFSDFQALSQNCGKLHHVCPFTRVKHLGFHWMDFYEI
jgi:hypothetical protein